MPKRIAIIEDDLDLAQNYKDFLEREEYAVDIYSDRFSALAAFDQCLPDMAVIDITLGDERRAGHRLCSELRQRSKTLLILFNTARDDELDQLTGLKLGANEYLSKTASLGMLSARIKVLFDMQDVYARGDDLAENQIECGPLTMNIDRAEVRWRGDLLHLTHSQFLVLQCLAERPGHLRTPQQLMDAAGRTIELESVSSYIRRIRAAFRAVDPGANPIQNEHSIGYKWKGDSSQ